ncbi:Nesprin-1 [Chamberlinius hualienensis]
MSICWFCFHFVYIRFFKMLIDKGSEPRLKTLRMNGVCNKFDSSSRNRIQLTSKQITNHKDALIRVVNFQEQYEKMLDDFSNLLEIAEGKLQAPIIVDDLCSSLKQESQRHKEFFGSVHQCHASLDVMADHADPHTRHMHANWHKQLKTQAGVILDQAEQRGHMIDTLIFTWEKLELKLENESTWLRDTIQKLADFSHPVTVIDITPCLDELTNLEDDIEEHRFYIENALLEVDSFLKAVQCHRLTTVSLDVRQKWRSVTIETSRKSQKLNSLNNDWKKCCSYVDVLQNWIDKVRCQLSDLITKIDADELDDNVILTLLQDVLSMEIRDNPDEQVEQLSLSLKQLLSHEILDEYSVKNKCESVEKDFGQLKSDLQSIKAKLESKISVDENRVMDLIKNVQLIVELIENDVQVLSLNEVSDYKCFAEICSKCEELNVRVSAQQRILDLVNIFVSRFVESSEVAHDLVQSDVEIYSSWSKEMGDLNRRWHAVKNSISTNFIVINALSKKDKEFGEKLKTFDHLATTTNAKLLQLKDQIKGNREAVQQVAKSLQQLHKDFKSLTSKVEDLKLFESGLSVGFQLPAFTSYIYRSIENVVTQCGSIETDLMELKSSQEISESYWEEFENCAFTVQQCLAETQYNIDQFTLPAIEFSAFNSNCEKLQKLLHVFQSRRQLLDELNAAKARLNVHDELKLLLDQRVQNLHQSWDSVSDYLSTHLTNVSQETLIYWNDYVETYRWLNDIITRQEAKFQLHQHSLNLDTFDMYLPENLFDWGNVRNKLNYIRDLSQRLESDIFLSESTRSHLPGEVDYLEQKVTALERDMQKDKTIHATQQAEMAKYEQYANDIREFLTTTHNDIALQFNVEEIEGDDLQAALNNLKSRLDSFSNYEITIHDLQALSDKSSHCLQGIENIVVEWDEVYFEVIRIYQKLLLKHLSSLEFSSKMERLREILSQVQRSLATESRIQRYEHLVQQQRLLDVNQSLLLNGQNMLVTEMPVDISDILLAEEVAKEFETLSSQLEENKQSVDEQISLWRNYKRLVQQFSAWLVTIERKRLELQIKHAPVKKIEQVVHQVQTVIKSMEKGRSVLTELQTAAQSLCNRYDDWTLMTSLHGEVGHLQQHYCNIEASLLTWQNHLTQMWELWNHCEQSVTNIQRQLKDFRVIVTGDLPDHYDNILAAVQNCQEYEDTMKSIGHQLDQLLQEDDQLIEIVSPDDMRILHHRVLLIKEMWFEIEHLLRSYRQMLQEKLNKWSNFDSKYQVFNKWLLEINSALACDGDGYLETVLNMLEEVYQPEIRRKTNDKQDLIYLAQELLPCSEDQQKVDISSKLQLVNEGWKSVDDACAKKLQKIKSVMEDVHELDRQMLKLCEWLNHIEKELASPITFSDYTKAEIDKQLNKNYRLQIDSHKDAVASIQSLCKVLIEDCHVRGLHGDSLIIAKAVDNLNRRWNNICQAERDRTAFILATSEEWKLYLSKIHGFETWLAKVENQTLNYNSLALPTSLRSAYQINENVEALLSEVNGKCDGHRDISSRYHRLSRENRLDIAGQLHLKTHDISSRYELLGSQLQTILKRHKLLLEKWDLFEVSKKSFLIELMDLHKELKSLENQTPTSEQAKTDALNLLLNLHEHRKAMDQEQLKCIRTLVAEMKDDELGVEMVKHASMELKGFEDMINEISSWIEKLQSKFEEIILQSVEVQDYSVQVDTLNLVGAEAANLLYSEESETTTAYSTDTENVAGESLSEEKSAIQSPSPSLNIQTYMRELEAALKESKENLDLLESSLAKPITYGPSLATTQELHKTYMAMCRASVDLVQHINKLLLEETGLPTNLYPEEINDVVERWDRLKIDAVLKDKTFEDYFKQWLQFHKDANSIDDWLNKSEKLYLVGNIKRLPKTLAELDSAVRLNQQLLLEIDHHKAVVMSLNLCSDSILRTMETKAEAKKIRTLLNKLNSRWEKFCKHGATRQSQLQSALMKCREFHHLLSDIATWVQAVENSIKEAEPVDVTWDLVAIAAKRDRFIEIKSELDQCELKLHSLKELTSQLLSSSVHTQDGEQITETIGILVSRVQVLQQLCNAYITKLNRILEYTEEIEPTRRMSLILADDDDESSIGVSGSLLTLSKKFLPNESPSESQIGELSVHQELERNENNIEPQSRTRWFAGMFGRVVRASLPIQALMLLLLGVAAFMPLYEEDYQCALSNNFARSLDPMLQYRLGPPPT